MIKIENIETYGWEAAIRGMRNPLNSWDKSDSHLELSKMGDYNFFVGENDLKLMKKLAAAGDDHGKFMRMIGVSMDITGPLYWWKEFDTYKVGTVANSCSTMHKIADKEFVIEDFSCEHLTPLALTTLETVINMLNIYRENYLVTKSKDDWWQMIQLLPSSYNQKRTITLNYAVLKNMYNARKEHKLDEWRKFCSRIEGLPYSSLICKT